MRAPAARRQTGRRGRVQPGGRPPCARAATRDRSARWELPGMIRESCRRSATGERLLRALHSCLSFARCERGAPACRRGEAEGSATSKLWIAFADEGGHAFLLVIRREEHGEETELRLHVGARLAREVEVRRLLRVGEGERALLREVLRKLTRLAHELARLVDVVHEPPVVGLLRADRPAAEDHLLREPEADDSREALTPAPPRDDPEVDLRLAELGVRGCEPDVAAQGELAAAP